MVILQQPDAVSLSANLKTFIISSSAAVLFTLTQGGETILSQRYEPNQDSQIEIDLRDVIESRLYFELRDIGTVYVQPGIVSNFTATIGNVNHTFRVLRGGVDHLEGSAESYLRGNFLTWQPTVKRVTYYTPEFLTYYATGDCSPKLRAYFTDDAGNVTSQADYEIASLSSGVATTLPLQYGNVVGWLDGRLPAWYDVWIEDGTGVRLTYIQRYVCDIQLSLDEDWFLFENSLGGIDTFRAYGDMELKAEHTHNVAMVEEDNVEYRIDTERIYHKNTGQLSKAEARWLLDYPPAKGKYIYLGNSLRRIVVTSSDLSGKLRTEPTSYSFSFKLADARPLLNVQREDVPAQMLNIVVPDLGNFTLPPRLAEFPDQPLSEGVLFPVQSPYSEAWGKVNLTALATALAAYIEASGGGGSKVDIIGENSADPASDFNVFSALRVLKEIQKCTSRQQLLEVLQGNFLRKDQPDSTNYLMKFLGGLEIGEAVDSMLAGKGIVATPDGRLQVSTLEVRNALKVMSLIIQEIHGLQGDYLFSDVGDVNEVEQLDATTYRLTIDKRSDTDITTLDEGDVLYQIVNTLQSGGGDYYTSWMRVVSRNTANNTIDVVLWTDAQVDGGTNYPPVAGYTVARRGNVNALLDPTNYGERGSLWALSSREQRLMLLADVVKPILEDYNYKLVLGKLPNIRALQNYPVKGDIGLLAQTVVAEKLLQFDWNGDVQVNKPDRGDWSLAVAQGEQPYRFITYEAVQEDGQTKTTVAEQHTVRHLGCVWGCLIDRTTLEPKWNSQGWTLLEGLRGLTLELVATNTAFYNRASVDTEVTPTLFYGQMDISSDVLTNDWSWTRVSSGTDTQFDAAWNTAHEGNGRVLHITGADLPPNWGRTNPCKFIITAYVRVGEDNAQSAQNVVNF